MDITITVDEAGHFMCTLDDGASRALVTASNAPEAGDDLMAALDAARETGLGECLWQVPGGEYRWMFRCEGPRLTVAVMWSPGTVIGWQHVFRTDCDLEPFAARLASQVAGAVLADSGL